VEPEDQAHEAALAALSRRALTAAELRARLSRKKFPKSRIEACLTRLRAAGLVDDRRVAYNFALSCAEHGRRGPARVRAALLSRGVAAAVADEAVAGAFPPAAQAESLRRAFRRATGARGIPRDRRGRERVIRQLRRGGFPLSQVLALLAQHGVGVDDLPAPDEDDDAVE
jgi:SOS response regulatory protein OraA/RecX